MTDSSLPPDSPFAEFAEKKPNALEYLEERRSRDRTNLRRRFIVYGILALAASLSASLGAAFGFSAGVMAWAMALGLCGAVVGVLCGSLVGLIAWSGLWWGARMGLKDAGNVTRGDSWDRMTIWFAFWAAIGVVCGASLGATKGVVFSVRQSEALSRGASSYEVVGDLETLAARLALPKEEATKVVLILSRIEPGPREGTILRVRVPPEGGPEGDLFWLDTSAKRAVPWTLGGAALGTLVAMFGLFVYFHRRAHAAPAPSA